MKNTLKTQFNSLIFLKQQLRFSPYEKSGVNNHIPGKQGIMNKNEVYSKPSSSSFYEFSSNQKRKVFLLHLCETIYFSVMPIRLRSKFMALDESNSTVKSFMILSYGLNK